LKLNNLDNFLTVTWLKIVLLLQVSNSIMNEISVVIAKEIVEKRSVVGPLRNLCSRNQSHDGFVVFLLQRQ
jgi:hypothetical protein